jgi:hypothetical protein
VAAFPVSHPTDAVGWTKVLDSYNPDAVHAWGLRKALHHLGLTDVRGGESASLTVLSLSSDPGALAIGPQVAVFAASLGIPTALIIDPQQDANTTAALRAACAVPPSQQSKRSGQLRVMLRDRDRGDRLPRPMLAIVVAVADAQTPRVAGAMRTAVTVLGVSAGAVTAEQLARAAAMAEADSRQISGILVADPDSMDHTTGRLPQLAPPSHRRQPTRLTSTPMETRW